MSPTEVFNKNIRAFNQGYRRIVNKGGTSSSKTWSELQLALLIAQKRKDKGVLISIVSESLPHLKMGCIRDFELMLKAEGLYDESKINFTERQYYFGKSVIEFFSADSGKATGPRRNILILNECNNIPYSVVEQLEMRTDECIFYDFNPTAEFWMEEKVLSLPENERILIKSNYKDNHHLAASIVREIELKAERDPNFKRIHIDVEYGNYEGLVFAAPKLIDAMPVEFKWRAQGLDFGFTNDPTTVIDVMLSSGELWLDELLYETGLTNVANAFESENKNTIDYKLKNLGFRPGEIIADSAEPKSIRELSNAGWNIRGCVKGKDSIENGIDAIKRYPVNVTKRSVNVLKEFRNYSYVKDKTTGKYTNEPVDNWNHCIDPTRYVVTGKVANQSYAGISWGE